MKRIPTGKKIHMPQVVARVACPSLPPCPSGAPNVTPPDAGSLVFRREIFIFSFDFGVDSAVAARADIRHQGIERCARGRGLHVAETRPLPSLPGCGAAAAPTPGLARLGHCRRSPGYDDDLTSLSAWEAESPVSTLENLLSPATQARLRSVLMHCPSPSPIPWPQSP
eukprot:scaffold14551_cov123-Isochrysis_galbana.AAC.2